MFLNLFTHYVLLFPSFCSLSVLVVVCPPHPILEAASKAVRRNSFIIARTIVQSAPGRLRAPLDCVAVAQEE